MRFRDRTHGIESLPPFSSRVAGTREEKATIPILKFFALLPVHSARKCCVHEL
jgi:hypothetical protein